MSTPYDPEWDNEECTHDWIAHPNGYDNLYLCTECEATQS